MHIADLGTCVSSDRSRRQALIGSRLTQLLQSAEGHLTFSQILIGSILFCSLLTPLYFIFFLCSIFQPTHSPSSPGQSYSYVFWFCWVWVAAGFSWELQGAALTVKASHDSTGRSGPQTEFWAALSVHRAFYDDSWRVGRCAPRLERAGEPKQILAYNVACPTVQILCYWTNWLLQSCISTIRNEDVHSRFTAS